MKRFEKVGLQKDSVKAYKGLHDSVSNCDDQLRGSNPTESTFSYLNNRVGIILGMVHLELGKAVTSVEDYSIVCRKHFIAYLYTDWWKNTQHELLNHEAVNKDPKCKRKRDSNDLTWFYSGRLVALQAAMFSDVETLQKIADWCEPWMVPEPRPLGVDPLVGKAFLVLVRDFRTQGKFDVEKLEGELKSSRKKGPKLLYSLWCAVREKDQAAFERLSIESVKQFEKTMPSERFTALDHVDIDTSLFVAAGRLKGMALPEFPEDTLLRLMTYETVTAGEPKSKSKKNK